MCFDDESQSRPRFAKICSESFPEKNSSWKHSIDHFLGWEMGTVPDKSRILFEHVVFGMAIKP